MPVPAEPPPAPIIPDERRMQLRAYELWNRLLGIGRLPAIEDLLPDEHPSLASNGVLIDYRTCTKDPRIAFLGRNLAEQCGVGTREVARLSDLPEGSLLARIAEQYLRAVVEPEPIGFEAEFVNQREQTILYRGILLPFSVNRSTIDHIFGVINWKELADEALVEELLLELGQVMASAEDDAAQRARPVSGSFGTLPAIGETELEAIDAAGGEVTLVAITRSGAGEPIVLGEVKKGSGLFGRVLEQLRR